MCIRGSLRFTARDTGSGLTGIRTLYALRYVLFALAPLLPCVSRLSSIWMRSVGKPIGRVRRPIGECGSE